MSRFPQPQQQQYQYAPTPSPYGGGTSGFPQPQQQQQQQPYGAPAPVPGGGGDGMPPIGGPGQYAPTGPYAPTPGDPYAPSYGAPAPYAPAPQGHYAPIPGQYAPTPGQCAPTPMPMQHSGPVPPPSSFSPYGMPPPLTSSYPGSGGYPGGSGGSVPGPGYPGGYSATPPVGPPGVPNGGYPGSSAPPPSMGYPGTAPAGGYPGGPSPAPYGGYPGGPAPGGYGGPAPGSSAAPAGYPSGPAPGGYPGAPAAPGGYSGGPASGGPAPGGYPGAQPGPDGYPGAPTAPGGYPGSSAPRPGAPYGQQQQQQPGYPGGAPSGGGGGLGLSVTKFTPIGGMISGPSYAPPNGGGAAPGGIDGNGMREKPPSRDAAAEAAAVHQAANPVVKWVNGYPQVATGGRKKALLIGINYTGTANALRGCHADVRNFKKFLVECNGFPDMPQTFRVLTDEEGTTRALLPTRKNMISGMQWLVKDAAPGDSLVMHFSGHGSQTRDFDGDEDDGMDETIIPLDFEALQSTPMAPKGMGHITDDEMHALLVAPLPAGVRLFCIFDSCHSGTALDLPVTYNADGTIAKKFTKQELLEAGAAVLLSGQNTDAAIGALQQAMTMVHQAPQDAARTHKAKLSKAHVVMLAGCKDMQTSADAKINGIATGAMSWAMLKAMREKPGLSTQQLLQVTRLLLGEHFSQIPQLSSGHPLDMDALFVL